MALSVGGISPLLLCGLSALSRADVISMSPIYVVYYLPVKLLNEIFRELQRLQQIKTYFYQKAFKKKIGAGHIDRHSVVWFFFCWFNGVSVSAAKF